MQSELPPFYNMTSPQRAVMTFIVQSIKENGQSPTIQEIADATDRFAPNVHKTLRRLETLGYITRDQKAARGITLTAKAQEEASK